MWSWVPWQYLLRKAARDHGFIDPLTIIAQIERLAEPAEVRHPLELIRAGLAFHARGLLNARIFQHNLDWSWPYWVTRQFDPQSTSFVPRAFSLTHINLTHRNWTALSLPDCAHYVLVDPRGLVTPFHDGWSIDCWLQGKDGYELLPARCNDVSQELLLDDGLAVSTCSRHAGGTLRTCARVVGQAEGDGPALSCRLDVEGLLDRHGWLVVSLRPYNPEGVSFIHDVCVDGAKLVVNNGTTVHFETQPSEFRFSNYRSGDVRLQLDKQAQSGKQLTSAPLDQSCPAGMVTAAALYPLNPGKPLSIETLIPLPEPAEAGWNTGTTQSWPGLLTRRPQLVVPVEGYQKLFDTALRTLLIFTPGEVYPGPFTYRRFWFRDATFILYALLCAGYEKRVWRSLQRFPERQQRDGYFCSQEGEWDANGEVLWLSGRYRSITGQALPSDFWAALCRGADWIIDKRQSTTSDSKYPGLLPAGFSAEHLGPNDYYFWDDYWAVAGLQSVAGLANMRGDAALARRYRAESIDMSMAIDGALAKAAERLGKACLPAAPGRRLDAGAIGSIVASYPLQLIDSHDSRLMATMEFLLEHCVVDGAFFQDMIHSGLNPYLTLHLAQVLLRAGDERTLSLITTVARLASPTGQWPEAIHPATGGGCMGDGQHSWAAAEWFMMMRNLFIREEGAHLILASGIPSVWYDRGECRFGPTATPYGDVTVTVARDREGDLDVTWTGQLATSSVDVLVGPPGSSRQKVPARLGHVRMKAPGRV